MKRKTLHRYAGLYISLFIVLHLINHLAVLWGPQAHVTLMEKLRPIYRHPVAEGILLLTIVFQIQSGILLFWKTRKQKLPFWYRVQRGRGAYLAFFFVNHLLAIVVGRYVLQLDTNLYFGATGLNSFPYGLFFIPYYSLAILSFFAHMAAIHARSMRITLLGLSPVGQAYLIIAVGATCTLLTLYGLTGGFQGLDIPQLYQLPSL